MLEEKCSVVPSAKSSLILCNINVRRRCADPAGSALTTMLVFRLIIYSRSNRAVLDDIFGQRFFSHQFGTEPKESFLESYVHNDCTNDFFDDIVNGWFGINFEVL